MKNKCWQFCGVSVLGIVSVLGCGKTTQFTVSQGKQVSPPSHKAGGEDNLNAIPHAPTNWSHNFVAEAINLQETDFQWNVEDSVHTLPIEFEDKLESISIEQPTLAVENEKFEQGSGATAATEVTTTGNPAKIDIALIVDNSASMEEEQAKLATKLSTLLSEIGNTDWRIAIVTTDPRERPLDKHNPRPKTPWCTLLKKGDTQLSDKFYQAVSAGIDGYTVESAFLRLEHLLTLECEAGKGAWYRSDAALAVVIISDEDNCSDGTECSTSDSEVTGGMPTRTVKSTLALLQKHGKQPGNNARVYGLIGEPKSSYCKDILNDGAAYSDIIAKTSGISGAICAPDYTPVLQKISEDFAKLASFEFELKNTPDTSAHVILKIDGVEVASSQYKITGKKIILQGGLINKGQEISVTYAWGDNLNTVFTLKKKAVNTDSIVVLINEKELPASYWNYNSDNTITFANPPAKKSVINIKYIPEGSTLPKKTFAAKLAGKEKVSVKINNADIAEGLWSIDADGNLTFQTMPPEGSTIEVKYFKAKSPKVKYPFTAKSNGIIRIENENGEIKGQLEGNSLKFAEQDIAHSKNVKVYFKNAGIITNAFALPFKPIPGTLKIDTGAIDCGKHEEISAQEFKLNITCELPHGSPIKFTYAAEGSMASKEFVFSEIAGIDNLKLEAFINDIPAIIESRDNDKIILASPVKASDKVRLVATPAVDSI